MNNNRHQPRAAAALLLILLGLGGCAPAAELPATPAVVIDQVEITSVVTAVQMVEVTRLAEVPVTDTPTPSPTATATPLESPTRTPIPSNTPKWDPPRVEVLAAPGTERTACWYGPSTAYLYKVGQNKGVWMRAIGRNDPGTWVLIKAMDDPINNACWVQADLLKFLNGRSIADVPVYWLVLPYSVLYGPPKAVSANRVGNEVTVFWQPVWMTEDDYRGYLLEAWVCQAGRQVFVPIGYVTTYMDNQLLIRDGGMIAVKVVDEPGCDVPSRARLYSVEKHGYTKYVMVKWPDYDETSLLTPTMTATPSPTPTATH